MTNYLKHKPGSIEEITAKMRPEDSDYQAKFKKELDKAGKGIGSMSPKEKKDFFNKIDKMHKAKNEITAAQKKLPPALQKAIKDKEMKEEDAYDNDRFIIKNGKATVDNSNTADSKDHVHAPNAKIALQLHKQGKKVYKEDLGKEDDSIVKAVIGQLKKATKAHAGQAKELDKAMKTEKDNYGNEINKAKHAAYKDPKRGEHKPVDPKPSLKAVAKTVKEMMRKKKDDVATMADTEKEKEKKTTLVGSKKTPVDTKPEVEYKN